MRWMKAAFAATCVSVSSGLLLFCVGDSPSTGPDASSNDSGTGGDADAAPPAQGFTLTLSPSHVTADPGDSNITIAIGVVRAQGFTDDVSFTITPPANVTASSAVDTGNNGTQSSFTINVGSNAALGDSTLTVTAANPSKSFVQNAPLGIHVGTLVDLGDGGITVPSWANALVVKAWGAGGGASCQTCQVGGTGGGEYGGGGGFASATVPVTPGSDVVAIVGTGGAAGIFLTADGGCTQGWTGGGGGGYSALQVKGGNYLVIAGGGGGSALYGQGLGGAGGGASGQDGTGDGGCAGGGGTQTDGGTVTGSCTNPGANGKALQGGDGYSWCNGPTSAGGNPGGGKGGYTGLGVGGGGGGWFGGGGGGTTGVAPNGGGGGGSGMVASDAGTLTTGSGASAANTSDPDFAHCASGSAAGGVPSTNNGVGGSGCLVIRYTKP